MCLELTTAKSVNYHTKAYLVTRRDILRILPDLLIGIDKPQLEG